VIFELLTSIDSGGEEAVQHIKLDDELATESLRGSEAGRDASGPDGDYEGGPSLQASSWGVHGAKARQTSF
jgi:hypothetical protein